MHIIKRRVVTWDAGGRKSVEPALGKCDCGCRVVLHAHTNTCERCGADYNSCGQRLAARELWGEETNEHWTECL